MVIKSTLVHSGWSYGKGDDQYDNESIGSTRTGVNSEKSMENSKRNKKIETIGSMCSRTDDKHTDEDGWTTIDVNNNRKPKKNNSKKISIETNKSVINVGPKIDEKGDTKAQTETSIGGDKSTTTEEITKQQEEEMKNEKQRKQKQKQTAAITTGKQEEQKSGTHTKTREMAENKEYGKVNKNNESREDTRSNNRQGNGRNDKKQEYVRQLEIETTSKGEEHKDASEITATATRNETSEGRNKENNRETDKQNKNRTNNTTNNDKNSSNTNNNGEEQDKNKNNEGGNKTRVNILEPEDMSTYAFTVSWRPEHKKGQDGKIIIKMLMREMAHRTPSIIFHPTNSSTSPVPRDINNINNDFPTTPANYDDFFDQMINRDNTNQSTFMKVTMPHDEKELQKKLSNYLFHNKIYMNSPFINDNTLEQVGFIENGHSRLIYRPTIEMKIRKGLKEVMEGESLTPQQVAQLKQLSSPIRVECHRGTVRAGSNQNQIVCEGIVIKTTKSQSKIAMELLSMLPETLLGEHYRIIPKSLGHLLGYELYGRIVADTVYFQNKLRPITIMNCHPSVFEDHYDSVKLNNSNQVKVDKFIKECCGAISIEETNETKEKGKYIVVVPEERVDSARTAIGKMFQEFQKSGGRPAAMACLTAYQNFPIVNDNVTISGHAQKLSEKIRDRYRNRPKTLYNQSSSPSYSYHGSTAIHETNLAQTTTTPVPRSIIRKGKTQSNATQQQWSQSSLAQQQKTTTNQAEERTVMSNLSPDDSAKTMMTNVSRMVETLGSVVNALAKETANTNDTMKQMMIQQTATMNNFMMLMSRNEDRRQEVPVREIQQTSTPTSTITNSQFSLSQQSTSANKRKIDGIADDETTAASTAVIGTDTYTEEDDIDAMLDEQSDAMEEIRTEQAEEMDVTMTDSNVETTTKQQQQQQEATTRKVTTAVTTEDLEHQFNTNMKRTDKPGSKAPIIGANRQ